MGRRASTSEPSFGSDSFLDVTANLVGVLIILIVLVGLRVSNAPPRPAAVDAAIESRLADLASSLKNLELDRAQLSQSLAEQRQQVAAKRDALADRDRERFQVDASRQKLTQDLKAEADRLQLSQEELAQLQSQMVSLSGELETSRTAVPAARELVHRSPVSQAVNSEELHIEIVRGRASYVDVAGLLEKAKLRARGMESELRLRGQASSEVGPLGGFRLRFTLARENFPFSQSLFYGSGSFQGRMVEWQVNPTADDRGEPIEAAMQPNSQLQSVLARHSPNEYAVTIWTYADSFAAFRLLRDDLANQVFVVAARPMPLGMPIRGSIFGSQSQAQ